MKKYIFSFFVIFMPTVVFGCCYDSYLYKVTNIKSNDVLNVRQEPHPLSPIVERLSSNNRYFLLAGYRDKNEEMHTHNLCVSVSYTPFEGNKSVSKWCKLENPKGWVNMYYLDSCKVETGDDGSIVSTQCSDVVKGKRLSDYLFRYKN